MSEGRLWMPPGTREGHRRWCERCGDLLYPRHTVAWEWEDEHNVSFYCRDCFHWVRENVWWLPKAKAKAEEYVKRLAMEGMVEQLDLDVKAIFHGLEKRKRIY